MRRILLSCLLVLALPVACLAQTMQIQVPAQTVKPGAVSCLAGQFVTGFDANGNLICAAGGGSAVTISSPAGSGISVTGGPAYVITNKWPLTPVSGSTTLACTDASATYQWTAATAGTITIPASGGAGCVKDTMFCVKNSGTGSVTWASSSTFSGGPITLNAPQDECVQADGAGKWIVLGAATAIANPNPIQ